MTRFVLGSADHIVTKAEYQVEFVRDTFGVDPGFTTVPTGVDFDVFDPDNTANSECPFRSLECNSSLTEDDKVVLYLAKLIPEKGPDKVLELLSVTDDELPPSFTFGFVGEFRGKSFEQRFDRLRRDLTHRTFLYPGRVPFEDVPELLDKADAVILLSESGSEGVPRILQESCAMQTPIIASRVTGIAKAFEDLPGCYLIDRDDPQEFETAVTQALVDSPEMPRELFADRFDMYRNYAKYAEVYEKLNSRN